MDISFQHPAFELLTGARHVDVPRAGEPVDREKVAQLAREFESMLILQMIRQMRQSMLGDAEEQQDDFGLGANPLNDTMDGELARALAAAGGLGVQPVIVSAFERQQAGVGAPAGHEAGPTADVAVPTAEAPARAPGAVENGRNSRRFAAEAVRAYTGTSGTDGASSSVSAVPAESAGPSPDRLESSWPLPVAAPLSSKFGWRRDPLGGGTHFHAGVDLKTAYGRPVPAVEPGRVVFAGEQGGYGLTVVVDHGGGVQTRYAHLSQLGVRTGEELAGGQVLGRVGTSGRSTGPHLHFEVVQDGVRIDPVEASGQLMAAGFKNVAGVAD